MPKMMDQPSSNPKNSHKRSPYLLFLKEKRLELLSFNHSLSKAELRSAIVAAWKRLSPAEKMQYRPERERLPAKVEQKHPDLLLELGKALKSLASYFFVRPI